MTAKLALDTNAYRALDDGNAALVRCVQTAAQLALPVIVLGELYYGIFQGSRREENLRNFNRFLALPRLEVLRVDEITAKLFGEIAVQLRRAGRPIQHNDMWIAALCKQHGYTLATADGDFNAVAGLKIVGF